MHAHDKGDERKAGLLRCDAGVRETTCTRDPRVDIMLSLFVSRVRNGAQTAIDTSLCIAARYCARKGSPLSSRFPERIQIGDEANSGITLIAVTATSRRAHEIQSVARERNSARVVGKTFISWHSEL